MRTRAPRGGLRLVAPILAASVALLAACSGGGEEATSTTQAGVPTATPVATSTPVRTPTPTPAAEDALRTGVTALLDAILTAADVTGAEWEQFDAVLVGDELAEAAGGADAMQQLFAACGLDVATEPIEDASFSAVRTFGAGDDPTALTLVLLSITEWSSPEQADRSLHQDVTAQETADCAAQGAADAGAAEMAAVSPDARIVVTDVEGVELEGAPDGILAWGLSYSLAIEGVPGVTIPPFTTRQVMLGWVEGNAVVQLMVQQMGDGAADVDYARLYDLIAPRFAEAYAAFGR